MRQRRNRHRIIRVIKRNLPEREKHDTGFLNALFLRINKERQKRASVRFTCGAAVFLSSVTAFLPAVNLLRAELAASGFMEYIRLPFSDTRLIAAYWHEFMILLLESMPVLGMTAFFAAIFALIFSIGQMAKANAVRKVESL